MRNAIDLDEIGQPDPEIEERIEAKIPTALKEKVKPWGPDRAMVRVVLHCPIKSSEVLPGHQDTIGVVRLDIEPKGEFIVMKWWSMARRYVGWFTKTEWLAVVREVQKEIASQAKEKLVSANSPQEEIEKLRIANSLLLCRVEELERKLAMLDEPN